MIAQAVARQATRHLSRMAFPRGDIRKIAVVGTGVIGSSWTALFLAKGHRVLVSDPSPGAKEKLAGFVKDEWPRMQRVGTVEGADPERYEFVEDIAMADLSEVDFVQEVSKGDRTFSIHQS